MPSSARKPHSPFLSRAIDCLPALVDLLAAGAGEEALSWARDAGRDCNDIAVALRREKQAFALALAIGDLAGAFPLLRVTHELSDFADRAVISAITDAIRRRVPDAEPAGFVALALGKHGARELNYSSDIDPILLTIPRPCRAGPATIPARRHNAWRARWLRRSHMLPATVMSSASTCGCALPRRSARWRSPSMRR